MESSFTLKLALTDAIPVVLFGAGVLILSRRVDNPFFLAGAILCLLAGLGKVAWKIVLAIWKKDISFLGTQLRVVMPAGFLLMIAGFILADRKAIRGLGSAAIRMPSAGFFTLAAAGLAGMVWCAGKYDRHNVRGNWIEQIINIGVQGCVLAGILCLR